MEKNFEDLTMNERLALAGIETVLTGRRGDYGSPEKALTDGKVCIYRPSYQNCIAACREHFGVEV